jgi:hypothetical protein
MEINNYSNEVLMNLFIIHGQCDKIVARTCRKFNEMYPNLQPMDKRKFVRIQNNFIQFGSQLKNDRSLPKPVTSDEENIVNVLAYFHAYPQASIRSAADDLGLTYYSVQRILDDHDMHPFKFTKVQQLKPDDYQRRIRFCEALLIRTQEDPNFLKKIIWTDEAKFSREGIFNRRNQHFWANENPHVVKVMVFQEKFSFNVFCLLKDNQIAFYIYDESLNSNKYLQILRSVVEDFVENLTLEDYRTCWFQLDGAPAHCTEEVTRELFEKFNDRWFRRLGPWDWPARSPDLTPLDFYFWGNLKQMVYKTPVNSKEELRQRVINCIGQLDLSEIQAATTHAVQRRILKCLEVNGNYFENLL